MNAQPKITIISIGRNNKAGLVETRRSVQAQTYSNLHHLLIDGASSDGSADLVAEWAKADERATAVSRPDSGIYDAMNRALDLVDGGYLLYLHAGDTFVNDGVIERAMQAIATQSNPPDLAIGWSRFVNGHGPMPYVVGGATPNAITSAHESTIFSYDFHQNERYDTTLNLAADYAFFRELAGRPSLAVLRLDFTISHFVFGGRSNDPSYDGARFLERARVDASFGESPGLTTYLRIGARMATRRVVYALAGADRAAAWFLRLACRRGNSGARALPIDQVDVEPRSAG